MSIDLTKIRAQRTNDQRYVTSPNGIRSAAIDVSVSSITYKPGVEADVVNSGSQQDVIYIRAKEEMIKVPTLTGDKGAPGNGIVSITKTGASGLVDTYIVMFDSGDTTTFEITNGEDGDPGPTGNGIASIQKTGSSGLVDTYTIFMTNGTTSTFTVTNGASGSSAWGNISGALSDQTDLQDALDAKADSADLGSMAEVDDAPSDGDEYVRKDGDWVVASGGGGTWGTISGTLSDQTDLQTALDEKLGDAPSNNNAYGRKSGGWYDLDGRYYTETEVDTALNLLKSTVAYYENGDTATQAISSGKYIIWKGVMYTSTKAIAVDDPLASTGQNANLSQIQDGGVANLIYGILRQQYYQSSVIDTLFTERTPTVLWTNPNAGMADGFVINLSSSDYDYLDVEFVRSTGSAGILTPYIQRFKKGTNITLFCAQITPNSDLTNTFIQSRLLTRNSDIKFTSDPGCIARWGATSVSTGNYAIPKVIYGIKY